MRHVLSLCLVISSVGFAQPVLSVPVVKSDLSKPDPTAAVWKTAPAPLAVMLMGQPMVTPRPETTTTSEVQVQALHDGTYVAFRLSWKDPEVSEAGPLGTFSDAAAIEFPLKEGDPVPPVMMGAKDMPVHLFHWRAQYQRDAERGKPTPKDLYPNLNVDMYPMEFKDMGTLAAKGDGDRDQFSPGRAIGNPQSYVKSGVDEIIAEGFSTSSVTEGHGSAAKAVWADGAWQLVITRPLKSAGGSELVAGRKGLIGFAVWQGGKGEVGSRKCVTMMWTTLDLAK